MRTIEEIIKAAGGADAIAERLPKRRNTDGSKRDPRWAVYKWKTNGVPARHWPVLIELAGATPDELLSANTAAQSASSEAAA